MELQGVHENRTYGYDPILWERAKREAKSRLAAVARSAHPTISYSDLAAHVQAIRFSERDHPFHALLGQVSVEEDAAGRGMLSVLVIHKSGDLRPGPGFFELAAELGRTVEDKEQFWAAEFQRVIEANGRRRVKATS